MSANQRAPGLSLRAYAPSSDSEEPVSEFYINDPQLGEFVVVEGGRRKQKKYREQARPT